MKTQTTKEHSRQIADKAMIDEALRSAGLHKTFIAGGRTGRSKYHAQARTPHGATIDFAGLFDDVLSQIAECNMNKKEREPKAT